MDETESGLKCLKWQNQCLAEQIAKTFRGEKSNVRDSELCPSQWLFSYLRWTRLPKFADTENFQSAPGLSETATPRHKGTPSALRNPATATQSTPPTPTLRESRSGEGEHCPPGMLNLLDCRDTESALLCPSHSLLTIYGISLDPRVIQVLQSSCPFGQSPEDQQVVIGTGSAMRGS